MSAARRVLALSRRLPRAAVRAVCPERRPSCVLDLLATDNADPAPFYWAVRQGNLVGKRGDSRAVR